MKAIDLMIGDWIYRMDLKIPVPSKIIGMKVINHDKMEYIVDVFNNNENSVELYLNEIEPIQLTPEILEKNGFSEVTKRKWVLSDKYTGDEVLVLYEVAKGFAMPTSGLTIGLQNVHELQHLFKLCGMAKEIEL